MTQNRSITALPLPHYEKRSASQSSAHCSHIVLLRVFFLKKKIILIAFAILFAMQHAPKTVSRLCRNCKIARFTLPLLSSSASQQLTSMFAIVHVFLWSCCLFFSVQADIYINIAICVFGLCYVLFAAIVLSFVRFQIACKMVKKKNCLIPDCIAR